MAKYTTNAKENAALTLNYTGTVDTIDVAKDGLYKLEVWGAQGGNGGNGGHSIGYKELKKGQKIYACIGGKGVAVGGADAVGGFNGGGRGFSYRYNNGSAISSSGYAQSGGGCTHIASVSGILASIGAGNLSKVFIVAGGGGGGDGGGYGGGVSGGNGLNYTGNQNSDICGGGGATQTSGGAGAWYISGTFGKGQDASSGRDNINGSGGGGGLYGGGAGTWSQGGSSQYSGGGGSGYTGGVPAIKYKGITYSPAMQNGVRNGHGMAQITMVKKGTPTMYWGDREVDSLYYGDREVENAYYGDQEVS